MDVHTWRSCRPHALCSISCTERQSSVSSKGCSQYYYAFNASFRRYLDTREETAYR